MSKISKYDYDVAIIGAGASGLAAALVIKKTNPKISVVIFEKKERAARKLAATGNGRCNLSNVACAEDKEVFEFFEQNGILLRKDADGRMYPYSEDARQLADFLVERAILAGADIRLSSEVKKVEARPEGGFFLFLEEKGEKRNLCAKKVLIATGGKSYPAMGTTGDGYVMARKLGHRVIPLAPGLTAICTDMPEIKRLKGLRAKAEVKLRLDGKELAAETGEIQFREDSLSGICIMNLSNRLKPRGEMGKMEEMSFEGYELVCDFAPDFEEKKLGEYIKRLSTSESQDVQAISEAAEDSTRTCKPMGVCDALGSILKQSLAEAVAARAGVKKDKAISALTQAEIKKLAKGIKCFAVPVTGLKGWKEAQITCGGVSWEEICEETMESKIILGLFFSGEVTDYAGLCGGFNLHHAWRTGILAGKGIAAKF